MSHERAVLHVVVGIFKGHADKAGDLVGPASERLQLGEQGVVDKVEQRVTGDALFVRGPFRPAQVFGQRRFVVVAQELQLGFAVVEDFEKKHPAELFKTLRVAVGAGVLAHDVLYGFDYVGDIRH